MATDRPVQLGQKVQFLIDKISKKHWEIRNSEDFEAKLNFVEYIDISIDKLVHIDKKVYESPEKNVNNDSQNNISKLYSAEKERLELQKTIVEYQKKDLEKKNQETQYETMKLKLANKELQVQKSNKIVEKQKKQIKEELSSEKQTNRILRQELQTLCTLNKKQDEQNIKIKQERNLAQKREIQLIKKYENQQSQYQKLQERNYRLSQKNTKGLKHTHTFVNTSNQKSSFQKYITLELPVCLQAYKIVYGIKIGIQTANKEILYYENLQLYEKQVANISLDDNSLVVHYKKRKNNNQMRLDNYKIHKAEIVVLLFGKGDGILIHES